MSDLVELFQSEEFKEMLPKWKAWHTLYEGEHDELCKPQFLWLHEYEATPDGTGIKNDGLKFRRIREQRSRYLNLMETIVSRWISFLFRGKFEIPDQVKAVLDEEMRNNMDGKGSSFESFVKEKIGTPVILLGKCVVLVDTPNVKANTVAEARTIGLRPYISTICPTQVPDWSFSADPKLYGKPQFVRTEYEREMPRTSETQKPENRRVSVSYKLEGGIYYQYVYIAEEKKEGVQSDGKGKWKLFEKIPFPNCKEIPLTIYNSESFIRDAAEMQLLLFNYMSAESSSINAAAFQKIFIAGESDKDLVVLLNEYAINLLSADATVTTVEPTSTDTLEKAIMRCIDWCFKVAFNQVEGLSAMSKESPSADTRRQMKDDFIALVETTLTEIENIIASMVSHVAMLKGMEPPTERVTIDKTVTDSDYEQEVAIWGMFADDFKNIASARKSMLKRQAQRLNLGDQDEIDKEIDEYVDGQATKQEQQPTDPNQQLIDIVKGAQPSGDTGATANQ